MTTSTEHLDAFVFRIEDKSLDFQEKHSLFSELCDTLDTYIGANEYDNFLKKLLNVFFDYLKNVPISFVSNTPEQKLRYLILDIIMRLPANDIYQQYVFDVYDVLINVIKDDNEENGIRCTKILISLHKSYKNYLSSKVEDYLSLLISIYKNMPQVVEKQLSSNTSKANQSNQQSSDDDSKNLLKASHSLKVAAECPVTLVSLYNIYSNLITSTVPEFLPLVLNLMNLQAEDQRKEHEKAKRKGQVLTHVSPNIQNKPLYCDFILCQIKAAFFLAFILIKKIDTSSINDRLNEIPDLLIRLLQDCPPESSSLRKELLYAIRHTLTTDLRKLYSSKFEILFNEKVLLGAGLTAHETLRPLAYTIVADFVHLNENITSDQIWKSVETFCEHLKDDSLTQNVYIMSAKLMLNLVDRITKLENKNESRQLFIIMIDAFGKRFSAVNNQYHDIMIQHQEYIKNKSLNTKKLNDLETLAESLTGKTLDDVKPITVDIKSDDDMDVDEIDDLNYISFKKIERSLPIQISQPLIQDPLDSARYMFKMFMTFLRSIFVALKGCNPEPPSDYTVQVWQEATRITSLEELTIFRRLFSESIDCLKFFQSSKLPLLRASMKHAYETGGVNPPITSCKEEKDLMELLAALFIQLEPSAFNEILEAEMPHLFDAILENPALLHVPQYFFANEMTTSNFSSILIVFCINKLPELGDLDIVKSNVLNRLFKFCFMSVNLFPNQNESVLLPHLNKLILDCLEFSTTAKDPLVYFYLIRTLFRAIGGGKFEALYKEIFSILQVLLECLSRLFINSRRQVEKDVFADLCLTVPVRLSVLVPYLHHLMRPLVHALNNTPDLVTQGLRTLELCVDNMTVEFIDPIIEPVIEDIMKALWKHLRPVPYSHQHSHTALRILGKMGGRNRSFIKLHDDLKHESITDQELLGMFRIEGIPNEVPVSMTAAISSALTALTSTRPKIHYRVSAFKYLTSILKLFINTNPIPDDYEARVQQAVTFIINEGTEDVDEVIPLEPSNVLDEDRFSRQEELLVELLKALFFSVSLDDVKDEANVLIDGICKHYVLLSLTKTIAEHHNMAKPFNVNNHEGKKTLSEDTLYDAIVFVLSHYNPKVREAGKNAIKNIFQVCLSLFGSMNEVLKFMNIKKLCSTFIHCCFKDAYYDKLSGCIGLQVMINDLGIPYEYFGVRQIEISRAMFFVLRDTPADVPSEVCEIAKSIILDILKNCNKEITKDMVYQQPFQSLISQIVYDLSNYNKSARETAQSALNVLSDITGVPISDMISPSKSVLLAPIFGKPLRALPFHMQIGNIDAITFCLQLDGSFLEFNDELNRLLSEALALVDADDESLISVNKITEHKSAEQLVNLRIVCIELLSLALTKQEFSNSSVRIRILSVFFKTLCSNSIRIIEAAYKGLSKVLSGNVKLPKELLQNGLRPMLMNLSDYKKLTVSGLEALSKLLELLISYFKVEIGRKLLDHLMAWAQPGTLQRLSKQKLESNHTIQIIAAIFKIFYMLPPQAYTFLKELIGTLLYLETNLRRHNDSPFRKPIAKFLDRFHEQAIEFFMENFKLRSHGSRFASFVGIDESSNLRNSVKTQFNQFMEMLINETDNDLKFVLFANMIDLIESIGINDSEWLKNSSDTFNKMFELYIECLEYKQIAPLDSKIHFQLGQSLEKLQNMYVRVLKTKEDKAQMTVSFVNYLSLNEITPSHYVEEFFLQDIVKSADINMIQTYLNTSINALGKDGSEISTMVQLLKKIIIPTLYVNAQNTSSATDLTKTNGKTADWIHSLGENVWNKVNETENDESYENDLFRVELMQLTSVMVEYYPNIVSDWKKDIIKFNWNNISLEDTITKQVAYVSIAYFIKNFETPAKLVIQVFVALLKANQTEVKSLVRQSLDLLAPKLNERLGTDTEWLKWTRRVLSENGYVVTQVLNVYQLIVQHPDLFYVSRDQFIPNIITAMGKLTVLNNSMTENQMLAMDLAELILNWEAHPRKEIVEQQLDPDAMDVDDGSVVPSTTFNVPNGQKETCITFLIRYICLCHQRASDNELSRKALVTLHILLSPGYWSDVGVKLVFLEKMLATPDSRVDNMLTCCVNALEALNVVLEWQPSEWIFNNLEYLQKLLDSCIRTHNQDIQEALQNVLALIIKAVTEQSNLETVDDEKMEKSKYFMNYLVGIVTEDLSSTNSVAAGVTLSWTITKYQPEILDQNLQLIIRTFGKLVKDHIALSMSSKGQTAADTLQSVEEAKMTSKLLETILNLCALRISVLGDQRRIYLSLLVQLIDRSNDKKLLTKIAEIVRGWVFAKDEIIPTVKEKAGVLSKMMMYEMKNDHDLTNMYYQIIVDIFKADSLSYSELTFRLEHPFLVGTKISDTGIRQELMNILSKSIDKDIRHRLFYVIREQNWEYLSEYPWLNQASQILYKSFDFEHELKLKSSEAQLASLSSIKHLQPKTEMKPVSDDISNLLSEHRTFLQTHMMVKAKDVLDPLLDLSYQSPEAIHNSWCNLFPVAYNAITQREKQDFLHSFVVLLSRDYHMRQQESVPNVIHIMLSASSKCPDLQLPPHLVKYLGLNYDAWYAGIRILEQIDQNPIAENSKIKESNKDALVEMYAGLQEDDMFYGLWRRRSKYFETNAALSYEQIGLWDKALKMYEAAQIKARSGVLPYSESEYALWEDDWILCAEKLQYWDVLTELAKHEGFTDLLLECGWRIADWIKDKEPLRQSVETVMDVPTPRRQMFQTFLSLQSYSQNQESVQNVQRLIDEGIQLALRKWWKLPQRVTGAHLSLLHGFQQYVEFSEAIQIYRSLTNTTVDNLDSKSQDLKRVLQAWRERLPNTWDDINIWNDLVTWRKHAFDVINKYYLPLVPAVTQSGSSANNSYAYRGYHEIAWVINRFAHVAREHHMPEVCINQLAKIYTLPNIEIQEAFLKLREQAKCYYQNPAELNTGLDVISNTNLVYFAAQQKAEFITLKGMFLAKLNIVDEANSAFATAVQLDLNLPKAWAEWGFFNDSRFSSSGDISFAKHAISCYLQAASLYKNNKARRLLCRILWLVGLDNAAGTLSESFLGHKGDMPVWHWVTFIPQLLTSLANKEGKVAFEILFTIAKTYPQALHFQLRTSKEDYAAIQKQLLQQPQPSNGTPVPTVVNGTETSTATPANGSAPPTPLATANVNTGVGTPVEGNGTPNPSVPPGSATPGPPGSNTTNNGSPLLQRKPWVWIDDISRIMKSAYPLLTLSLESFVDQINQRFKINADADAYRLIVALYHDGVQQFNRLPNPRESVSLPPATEASIERFAESVLPAHIKTAFNEDIIQSKPNLETYISKLLKWKTCMEERLDSSYGKVYLERVCPHLSQFHHQKFEDIDIPGQYLLNKESNQGFVKIERFMPIIDMIRGPVACYKRITIRGTDGSYHKFAIQFPAARHCRREERMYQMFRLFNDKLSKNVQTRRRNIEFTIPVAIPLSPHIRMVSDDELYVNMYNVYERSMKAKGQNKDEPLAFYIEKLRSAYDPRLPKPDVLNVKTEILSAIQTLFVPTNMMKDYFVHYYPKFEDFWVFRKQFTSQYATFIFATYMMCINGRQPHKIHINQGSGKVYTSEMLPYKIAAGKTSNNIMQNSKMDVSQQRAAPIFCTLETVPFRLTPNIQELIGAVGTEGILSVHMVLIAQCLADPSYNIDHFLNLFVRDEVMTWYTQRQKNIGSEIANLQEIVTVNVESINKKITSVANFDTQTQNQSVASQVAVNLIAHAVNPRHLANSDSSWMPYF